MKLNLGDDKFAAKEFKKIFNDGNAGVVRNCALTVKSKGPDDSDASPAYKLIFTDTEGAEINRGIFKLREDASQGSVDFFGKEMVHLMNQLGFTISNMEGTPEDILKEVMKGVYNNANGKKFGVSVCYGTIARPKSFLEVDGFWGYRNEDNIADDKPMQLSKNAVLVRPQPSLPPQGPAPTAEGIANGDWSTPTPNDDESDDLPF